MSGGKYLGLLESPTEGDLDREALVAYLLPHIGSAARTLRVRRFIGGQSNPTYLLETAERSFVLRRKPLGPILPSAHQIDREYRVISALHAHGLAVPEPVSYCNDPAVIGAPFYLMAHVAGRIFLDCAMPDLAKDERTAVFDSVNQTLADLHRADLAGLGLADYGRPGNYFGRQIARWSKQYQASETEAIPAMSRLIEWLPQALPDDERTTLVHGDYSFHNVIIDPEEPKVLAVLDWELSTTGHPLADLTYHLMEWYRPPGSDPRGTLRESDLEELGIPSEEEYAARYFARTGLPVPTDLGFYRAYNLFRVAAIIQGIVGRARAGNANAADAAEQTPRVRRLAEAAWQEAVRLGA